MDQKCPKLIYPISRMKNQMSVSVLSRSLISSCEQKTCPNVYFCVFLLRLTFQFYFWITQKFIPWSVSSQQSSESRCRVARVEVTVIILTKIEMDVIKDRSKGRAQKRLIRLLIDVVVGLSPEMSQGFSWKAGHFSKTLILKL